jgi:cystathionine beta-lyase
MSQQRGVDRRAFLKNAGMTALAAGAVGTTVPAAAATTGVAVAPPDANGKFDFDTVYNRVGTNSTKWDRQIALYGKDNIAVGMGIADIDFKAAPSITQALNERLQHENWGYLDTQRPFIETVVAWNKRRYGIDIDPASVVMATGVHPALISAIATFSPRGSKVLLQTPTYNGFYSDLTFTGTIAEESPLRLVNGRYQMDFEDLDRRISHDTNTLILCNPQNPTGNCWSKEDLTTLGEICLRRRVVVLADEIHCDYVTKGNKYTPFASLPNKAIVDNSITFKAASKSFGLAAMKCAWMYSTNPDHMARIRPNHRADLTTLGLIASHAAYTGGEEWLNQVVDYIDGTHDFVESFVRANIPMIKTVKPQGTYLSWLDMSELGQKIGATQMAEEANRTRKPGTPAVTPETMIERWLVKNAKVHLNQGASYGRGGAGHMRMNIGTSRKLVELALTNIADALRKT